MDTVFQSQVFHGPVSGSHPVHVLPVTRELLKNGHSVTTVIYRDANVNYAAYLNELGPNHTLIQKWINNENGTVPWVSKVMIIGVFICQLSYLWFFSGKERLSCAQWHSSHRRASVSYRNLQANVERNVSATHQVLLGILCHHIWGWGFRKAGDTLEAWPSIQCQYIPLTSQLRASHFDVAIVDLCWGECAHAFAAAVLGLPIIVYWPNSPGGANLGCCWMWFESLSFKCNNYLLPTGNVDHTGKS